MEPWLVVIDPQVIFADPSSDWGSPMFAAALPVINELVADYGQRVIVTRWLPGSAEKENRVGSWQAYFKQWPFADQADDDPLFDLVEGAASWSTRPTLDVTTFGKWPALESITGPHPRLTLAGVSTDCCVISTALAAADAGCTIEVVGNACAGSTPENHAAALQVMGLYAPQITVTTHESRRH